MSLATLPQNLALRIVPRPAVRLVGVRIRTSVQKVSNDVSQLWHKASPQIGELSRQKKDVTTYGISWVIDPETHSLDYCAAVRAGQGCPLPEGFEETIIPAGLYAECTLPSRDALHHLCNYLYHEWLPLQEKEFGIENTPCYEVYPDGYLKGGHMKFYIPVVGKT